MKAWLLYKTYLSVDEIYRGNTIDSLEDWMIQDANDHSDSSLLSRAHVRYTCYFNSGLFEHNSESGRVEEICPSGMYGVWEMASSESHFSLDKGGVFRAVLSNE